MDFELARFNMVEQQIRTWDVLDQDVLDLLFVVRREDFVPPAYRQMAFSDLEIPLAIDGRGAVKTCKVVSTTGEMTLDYGCAEARAEKFQASMSRGEVTPREGYMTVLIYAHPEHMA